MEEVEREEPFQPIVYFEDPSYARIPDENLRRVVRQWRYLCEREIGIYNADLNHRCSAQCMEPIDEQYIYSETEAEFKHILAELREQYDYLRAGPIRADAGLYGCPRSGVLHWCPPTMELRQRVEGGCQFVGEGTHGEIVCLYSGRVVYPSPGQYDRFTDDTIAPNQHTDAEDREAREYREAAGLNKHYKEPVYISPAQKQEMQRTKVEHQSLERLNRNLENRYQRQTRASGVSVVPSLERSPRKNAKPPYGGGGGGSGNTTITNNRASLAPHGASAGVGGPEKKRKLYDAGYNLHISQETMRTIRHIITHLLTDRDAQITVGHEGTKALESTHVLLDVCLKRVARMYALISNEKELDRTRTSNQHLRHGACASLNIKNITLTTLYTYAKGFNIESTNLIPLDDVLAQLLPLRKNLPWFGLDPTMRQYLRQNNQHPEGKEKRYDTTMTTAATLQIQQMIRNYPHGTEHLKLVLNDV